MSSSCAGPSGRRRPDPVSRGATPLKCFRSIRGTLQAGSLAHNVPLREGDVVIVPRAQSVYVVGQVSNPGAYTMEKGTTVLQALAMAGGVTERGSTSRIRIIRLVNGEKKEIRVSVDDPVRAGDTVMVPERFF